MGAGAAHVDAPLGHLLLSVPHTARYCLPPPTPHISETYRTPLCLIQCHVRHVPCVHRPLSCMGAHRSRPIQHMIPRTSRLCRFLLVWPAIAKGIEDGGGADREEESRRKFRAVWGQ